MESQSCGKDIAAAAQNSYVRFDIIRRILSKVFEKDVVMVMVITDIDDKIIKRANELNISPMSLARTYEEDFKQDMASLKVLRPTVYMRVTDHIPQIISFTEQIIKNGHAYATVKGNVYFDVKSIGDKYGKFSSGFHNTDDELGEGDKRYSRDFALWKTSKPQEPFWSSPWGNGRPGWHIECSTIASLVFGDQLDIHSGGIDLAFPHHENEIAQCEAYHKCEQWGNYFLHSGHLNLKGNEEKMSKSLKNYITIKNWQCDKHCRYCPSLSNLMEMTMENVRSSKPRGKRLYLTYQLTHRLHQCHTIANVVKDFLKTYSADQFRMFCLRCKYRSAVDFSDDSMSEAKNTLQTISSFINDAKAYMRGQLMCHAIAEDILWKRLANAKENVRAAFADDFDTPRAIDSVMDLIHHSNRQLKPVTKESMGSTRSPVVYGTIVDYIEHFFDTVGISVEAKQFVAEDQSSATLNKVIDELLDFRSKVRNYALDTLEGPESEQTAWPAAERQPQKEKRLQLLREREPLLKACDTVRRDLAAFGINVKEPDFPTVCAWKMCLERLVASSVSLDRGNKTTWELLQSDEKV